MDQTEDRGGEAPCYQHLLVGGESVDPGTLRDVARFRTAERKRLLDLRKRPVAARQADEAVIAECLERILPVTPGITIAAYWPIRGEPDLRRWMGAAVEAGADVLLPVVVAKQQPLEFHAWTPGCAMTRGVWNIPVPEGGQAQTPDVVISPLVGVDETLFRLGNGGGYYDRTLAALDTKPRVIGVGYAGCQVKTIFPMHWDVPMDEVVLSDGTVLPRRVTG